MSEKTSTEKLRELLNEMGVEYDTSEDDTTIFYDIDGNRYTYNVNPESGWAQLYGYNLTPEQAIAATVGNAQEPTDAVIGRIKRFCRDYARCLVASTVYGKHNHERIDRRALDKAESVEAKLIRELAEDIATVGAGTCQIETTESWLPAQRYHRCKHCGAFFAVLDASRDIPPRVCPNCGRRIEVK